MNQNVERPSTNREEPLRQQPPAPPPSVQSAWNARRLDPQESRRKSPALAAALSALPGLGQVYVGYYQDAFINILVVGSVVSLLNLNLGALQPLAAFFLAFFWLYNIVDAGRKATLYNQALAGLGPFELPEPSKAPGGGGLLAGILLILVGALAFAHTMFDISLRWLEDWWPLAVVALGCYLVYKAWAEQKGA